MVGSISNRFDRRDRKLRIGAIKSLSQLGSSVRPKRPRPTRLPLSLERTYLRALWERIEALREAVRSELIPKLSEIQSQARRNAPQTSARQDAWIDDIGKAISEAVRLFGLRVTDASTRRLASDIASQVSAFNYKEVDQQLDRALGVNVFISEPWLEDQLKAYSVRNYDLIKSIEDREIARLNQVVTQGFAQGQRWETISDDIEATFDVSKRDAERLARDQVNKMNGELTRLRQTSLGVDKYVWTTAGDERVRDSHAAKEGKVFSWDKPPADTGHPGEDINCRCIALPVLTEDVAEE